MFRYLDWKSPAKGLSLAEMLPDELLIAIFKYLPLDSLLACEAVSKRWRRLATDSDVWKYIIITYSGKPELYRHNMEILKVIATHRRYIQNLKLANLYNYLDTAMVLDRCDNLTTLDISLCCIHKEFEICIEKFPNLKKLSLQNCSFFPNSKNLDIRYDKFIGLNSLTLDEFGLSQTNCGSLIELKNLCHIVIDKIKGLSMEYITNLILSKQDILVTFHIYGGASVDDNCLVLLSQCPRLRDLSVVHCHNLSDEGILALRNLKVIQQLQISNNEYFTEASLLKTLGSPSLVKLHRLSLSQIKNVTSAVVDCISEHYKNLKSLALYQCPRIVNSDYEKQLRAKFRKIDVVLY